MKQGLLFGCRTANRQIFSTKFEMDLGTMQLSLSAGTLLLGGNLQCGQGQGAVCLLTVDVDAPPGDRCFAGANRGKPCKTDADCPHGLCQDPRQGNAVLDPGAGVGELGVLYAVSQARPLVLFETAGRPRIVALNWTAPPGAGQIVLQSGYLPDPCAPGAYMCSNQDFVLID